MSPRERTALAVLAAAIGAVGCSAILGIPDVTLDPTIGAEGGAEGGPKPDGGDAAAPDAGDGAAPDSGPGPDSGPDGGPAIVPLATQNRPWAIALDQTHVFWSEPTNQKIVRADKDGSNAVALAQGSTAFGVNDIQTDGTDVYWCNTTDVYKCAVGGCSNAPTKIATLPNSCYYGVLDASYFYVSVAASTSLWRIPKGGSSGTQLATFNGSEAVGLGVDSGFVIAGLKDGSLVKVPTGGGNPIGLVAAGGGGIYGLTIYNARAYYSTFANPGTIAFAPLADGGATPIALNQTQPFGIANDGNNVYWVNQGTLQMDGQVQRCSLASCMPAPLADKRDVPKDIALDGTSVYWAEFGNGPNSGGVYKVAK